MQRVLFVPFSVAGGLLAGLAGKKVFDLIWAMIDDQEPPQPEHRETSWPKLIAALALQGAIFRAAKGVADHGARRAFARSTGGSWPGEEEPDPA